MEKLLDATFARPRGALGWLGGFVLAIETRERQSWVVSQLGLQQDDRVLEVGFGPGVAMAEVARVAAFVGGVEQSAVMMAQARRRNAAAIRDGRVELRQGRADKIPYPDESFDVAFAVNSIKIWPDPVAGLREMRRVVSSGGVVAIAWQPIPGEGRDAEALAALGEQLVGWMAAAGLPDARAVQGGPTVVLARAPVSS